MDADETNSNLLHQKRDDSEIKAYGRRWVMLGIFILYQGINAYQWIEYSIINNIVTRYYNVSPVMVDWTSILYMAFYAPLVVPASYILEKKDLRAASLIGGLGTAIGTAIKVFLSDRDSLWLVLLSQGIVAASQTVILCLPPRLAAVWFKASEVSTACSLGAFGNQLRVGLGFILPPMIVKNRKNVEDIGYDLKVLCWSLTAIMAPVALAIFYFPNQPRKPPSVTQMEERRREEFSTKVFIRSMKDLIANRPFVLHVIFYGMFGSILLGVIPNKIHKYKYFKF